MKKSGMSLMTLVITVILMIIIAGVAIVNLSKSDIIDKAEQAVDDMNLKNIQQIANMAYADIYFDNLISNIRRELTAEEIRERMIQNGMEEDELNKYDIVVEDGDVFVTIKE